MSKVEWRVTLYERLTSGWSVAGIDLTDFTDVTVNVNVGTGKDSFSFNIMGADNLIEYEDKIVISRKSHSGVFTDSDLLINGVVRTVAPDRSGSIFKTKISGYNYSESVMSGLVFVDAIGLTIPEMFKQAINSLVLASDDFAVVWNDSNPEVTSNGALFPVIGQTLFNKPFKDLLDRYSRSDKTRDGNYHWYVNVHNELTWGRNKGDTTNSFDEVTNRFSSIKTTKDTNDVKNFVVVKGGYDPKNRILQERYADYSSISKHGFKYYIVISENKTGASVYELDLQDFGVDDMRDASYPLTPRWSDTSKSGFSDYADDFRTYMRDELKSIGKEYVDMRKNGKLKITLSIKPKYNSYVVGNLIDVAFIDASLPNEPMRVNEINYNIGNDVIVLEQDEGSL